MRETHAYIHLSRHIYRALQHSALQHTTLQHTAPQYGGHVSAFSYMERQTNNSGLVAKLYMKRQAKSRDRPCLGIKDRETKMHITQKLFVGFLPNLHQQTRRVFVHLFVYEVIIVQTQN